MWIRRSNTDHFRRCLRLGGGSGGRGAIVQADADSAVLSLSSLTADVRTWWGSPELMVNN